MGPKKILPIIALLGTFGIGIIIFLIVKPYAFAETTNTPSNNENGTFSNYSNGQSPKAHDNIQPQDNLSSVQIERNRAVGGKLEEQLLFEEGRDLYEIGDYDESMKKLKLLQRLYPTSRYTNPSHVLLGKNYLARGDKNNIRADIIEARNYLISALKTALKGRAIDQATVNELVDFIVATSEANRRLGIANEEIEAQVQDLLLFVDGKSKSELNASLGFLRFFRDDYQSALRAFQQSNSELALVGKAKVYLAMEDYDRALTIFSDFIEYHKDSIYYEEMFEHMQKHGLTYGKKLYREKNIHKAYQVFSSLNKHFSHHESREDAQFYMGLCHWEVREFDLAIKWFDKVLDNNIDIRDDDALFWKARSIVELGNLHEALSLFTRLLDFYHKTPYRNEAISWKSHLQREIEAVEELGNHNTSIKPYSAPLSSDLNTEGITEINPIYDTGP